MNLITIQSYQSPLGKLILGSIDNQLCLCDWESRKGRESVDRRVREGLKARFEEGDTELLREAGKQLTEYFHAERSKFSIPLKMVGSPFQLSVWNELLKIPFGNTLTYEALTARIGDPGAIRAVAAANGANALSIFIPCHRIIGKNSALTGYAGGLAAKRALLKREGAIETGQFELF